MKTPIALVALTCSALLSPLAIAAADDDYAVEFEYNPAALATVEGAEAAYDRIEDIARRTCQVGNQRLTVATMNAKRECEAELINSVVDQLAMPMVTAVHTEAETGARL